MILIDTDICIALLKGRREVISNRGLYTGSVAVSFMTAAELYYGAEKSQKKNENLLLVEQFLITVEVLNTDSLIVKKFASLKTELELNGTRLADADLFIAATSLVYCEKLVTGNLRHFERIAGLQLENWL